MQRNAMMQCNATQRNTTQRNATQRNATQRNPPRARRARRPARAALGHGPQNTKKNTNRKNTKERKGAGRGGWGSGSPWRHRWHLRLWDAWAGVPVGSNGQAGVAAILAEPVREPAVVDPPGVVTPQGHLPGGKRRGLNPVEGALPFAEMAGLSPLLAGQGPPPGDAVGMGRSLRRVLDHVPGAPQGESVHRGFPQGTDGAVPDAWFREWGPLRDVPEGKRVASGPEELFLSGHGDSPLPVVACPGHFLA